MIKKLNFSFIILLIFIYCIKKSEKSSVKTLDYDDLQSQDIIGNNIESPNVDGGFLPDGTKTAFNAADLAGIYNKGSVMYDIDNLYNCINVAKSEYNSNAESAGLSLENPNAYETIIRGLEKTQAKAISKCATIEQVNSYENRLNDEGIQGYKLTKAKDTINEYKYQTK